MGRVRKGAYGFAFEGLGADRWLVEVPNDWPLVHVDQTVASAGGTTEVGEDTAIVSLLGGRELRIDRRPPRVSFVGPSRLTTAELIHPFLSPAASVLADWHGWIGLHAGGFVLDGAAWLVAAGRDGGKSTTLAAIADRGHSVLADDLIVIKGGGACAGPRSIDLREPRSFQGLEDLGVVGERRRWRMNLAPVPSELPVKGIINLAWSNEERVRLLPVDERVETLLPTASMPLKPKSILELLALDAYVVSRPRGDLSDTLRLMAEVTGASLES